MDGMDSVNHAKLRLKNNLKRTLYCFFTDISKYLHRCYFKSLLYHKKYNHYAKILLSSDAILDITTREDHRTFNPYHVLHSEIKNSSNNGSPPSNISHSENEYAPAENDPQTVHDTIQLFDDGTPPLTLQTPGVNMNPRMMTLKLLMNLHLFCH